MRILVTAGPTHEYIDAVRFIGNPSSGKMGFAVAEAAHRAGHSVTLVSGPVTLKPPSGVRYIPVVSARDMYREVLKVYPKVDAVVMTAAVSDFRPAQRFAGKLKKNKSKTTPTLTLVQNPDILAALGRRKGARILIGFALEAQNPERNALKKLREKNLDYLILDRPAALAAERMEAILFDKAGHRVKWSKISKKALAGKIVTILERAVQV